MKYNYASYECTTIRPARNILSTTHDIEVEWRYSNNTSLPLVIRDRSGQSLVIGARRFELCSKEFVATRILRATKTQLVEYMAFLEAGPVTDMRERQAIIDAARIAFSRANRDSSKKIEVAVDYVVSEEVLAGAAGPVYLRDIDLLIAVGHRCRTKHPASIEMRDVVSYDELVPAMGKGSWVMAIKMVDNDPHKRLSSRYLNVAGDIYEIPAVVDRALESGVHIHLRSSIDRDRERTNSKLERHFMPVEEAEEKYGLKQTVEEAKWGGSISMVGKGILESRTWENKMRESELLEKQRPLEREHELRMKELDRDAQIKKAELSVLKAREECRLEELKRSTRLYDKATHWLGSISGMTKATIGLLVLGLTIYQQYQLRSQ
ncbi:hypothetical protein ACLPJK_25755 [Pseudomonas aeruginosa]|uniref:hypothetical protein n=1 Tax=Pseudomonas aeruginosa TaxID=287 RepID=UPI003D2692A6